MKEYDLIVIGGGTAGMNLIFPLTKQGWRAALVETRHLGGTCINIGCIPSKTLISSARVMQTVRDAHKLGVVAEPPRADWPAMVNRKDELVGRIRDRGYKNVGRNDNITLYEGRAAFSGPKTIEVNGETITAPKIVIAAGARTAVPPVPGLEEVDYLTSTSVMEMKELPGSMLILGGGIIALEFSQLFVRLGVEVTILQRGDRLAPNLDPEISDEIEKLLDEEGIRVMTDTNISSIERKQGQVIATDESGDGPVQYSAEQILVATGRRPNSDWLDLEKAGVDTDQRGYIAVDQSFKTSAEGIWALGDITGGMMFTHRAWHDANLLTRHFLQGEKINSNHRLIPFAVFTEPEIAAVGLDEAAAKEKGYDVGIHHFPFRFQGRARAMEKYAGFIKMTVDNKDNGKILGTVMIGPEAGELIHELIAAIRFGATVHDLYDMIHVHPTLSEAIHNTAGAG